MGAVGDLTGEIVAELADSGDTIRFPAVSLLQSPQGVTVPEILQAFNTANAGINRGVSYTVGQLDRNPIIQAPTGSTYETSGGNAADYPDLT